jgi:hypothetical protein
MNCCDQSNKSSGCDQGRDCPVSAAKVAKIKLGGGNVYPRLLKPAPLPNIQVSAWTRFKEFFSKK